MTICDSIDYIAYLEGEDPRGKITQHIKQCAHCRRELEVYRKLIGGMAAYHGTVKGSCPRTGKTIEAGLGEADIDPQHIAECAACNDLYKSIIAALENLEEKVESISTALPKAVTGLVAERKKKWMTGRLEKVLDLQGFKDKKQRKDAIQKMLDKSDEELPKAAFPDDLIGKKKEEKEDDKKE